MQKKKRNAKKLFFAGFTALAVILLVLAGCPTDGGKPAPKPPDITWELEQVGGEDSVSDTTGIKIMFNAAVSDLLPGQVTVSGAAEIDGAASFSQDGNDWTIPVTVGAPGNAQVTVARNGVENVSKLVTVHKAGVATPATWQAVPNGASNTGDTTELTFTFNKPVILDIGDIAIAGGTGSAEKGTTMIGSDTTYLLPVIVTVQGNITVSIDADGIDANPQTVPVYLAASAGTALPDKPSITKMEDGLHFTDSVDLSSQAAIDSVVILEGDQYGSSNTRVVDESKVRANVSLRWTGEGADSYNVYYADENFRPETPQITGITVKSAFVNNLDPETKYYFWVEAVNASGKMISDVRDRDTRDLGLERGDYLRSNESGYGIEPENGQLTVMWDLRDRVGWFEVYYAPVGAIPHVDFYASTTFPNDENGEWYHAYQPTRAIYPFCSPLFDYNSWAGFYFGAANGGHPDTRPVLGVFDSDRTETPPILVPENAFPYLGESWVEGGADIAYGINAGQRAGLGKLQPYRTVDSRFNHPDVKSWNGTAAGPGNVPVPFYGISTTITGLTNGTQYEVWIRCPNVNGERGYWYGVGTPGSSGLAAPANIAVSAPAGATRELQIEWDPVAGATSYRLYFSSFNAAPTATSEYTRIDAGANSERFSQSRSGLLPSTTYYVWVVAELSGVAGEKGSAVVGRTGSVPSQGIPGKEKKIAGTNNVVKTLMYVEVNDFNPLNAGSYILEDGAYLFDYVVIFASNIRNRNCALESEPHGCTRNGPHIHHNPNNRHILDNASKYIKPLQDKGIKVLMGILPDHDGISLGTMSPEERAQFVETVRADVVAYGLDGIDLDDEWASKEDWDNWPNQTTPSPNSIWVYPSSSFGWPFSVQVYRNPDVPIGPGNGSTNADISTTAQRNTMWYDLGVETFKSIQALRAALGPDRVISVYEYNTGRYITPNGVNPDDSTVTASALAQIIDFSLQPWYNQYYADSANSLPRSKYGPLAVDVGGGAYAGQNGSPLPPMDTTGANSITDYSTRYKDSADPYGYICLYGLNPAREMLRRDTSSSTPRNVTKEEYLSIMTEIIFGQKTILTAEGGDYLKDW